jgi:hypothetical protein
MKVMKIHTTTVQRGHKMSEQDKMAQFVFTVVVIPDNKQYEVELWDFSGTKPDLIAAGEGSNWRTALGQALSKIELPTDKKEVTDV